MIDSWRARKLEPGLAVQYSIPSALMTSTMKSEPGRSLISKSTGKGVAPVSCATASSDGRPTREDGAGAGCAGVAGVGGTNAAAPAAVAPFKNPRRPKVRLPDFAIDGPPG